jgi:hypothetical protein
MFLLKICFAKGCFRVEKLLCVVDDERERSRMAEIL